MLYLSTKDLLTIGIDWKKCTDSINGAVQCLYEKDFAQPVKPYLRFRDLTNRIIAMPAFVGGSVNMAGIKWISSFPGNINKQLPRASSLVVLNDVNTGVPLSVINSSRLSAIRTASVTAFMLNRFLTARGGDRSLVFGMTGFGPIGQMHLEMIQSLAGQRVQEVLIFDLRPIDLSVIPSAIRSKIRIVKSWQEAYVPADVFMTCTVSKERYIDLQPKPGSFHANVSLRDYGSSVLKQVPCQIVDDWTEVCRENTDVEAAHKEWNLTEADCLTIADFAIDNPLKRLGKEESAVFHPMGMAVFDLAIAGQFYASAIEKGIGTTLES